MDKYFKSECSHTLYKFMPDGKVTWIGIASGKTNSLEYRPEAYGLNVEKGLWSAVNPDGSGLSSLEPEAEIGSQFDIQVGGQHYSKRGIQPLQYILANKLDFPQGNIVKYATRHADKNGAEDIMKVIQYAQFILEDTYGINSKIEYQEVTNG